MLMRFRCLTLAGLLACSFQCAGNYSISLAPGWHLIANHLEHMNGNSVDNHLSQLMPSAPENTHIYKYNHATSTFVSSTFSADNPDWDNDFTLDPGEAAIIFLDASFLTGNYVINFT